MNRLMLRPLSSDLLAAAVALDHCCLGGLWTLEGYRRELESPNSELLVLQPTPSDHHPPLLGLSCIWSIVDEAHITVLAVHPDYRRQGLGQALLCYSLQWAQQNQLSWATLEVRASNQAAIALYERFGFERVGTRNRYYPDGEDALILWRKGLQYPDFTPTLQGWQQQVDERFQRSHWQLIRTE